MSLILTAVLLAKLPLVVRTYNTVGLSPATLERAQVSAGAALAAIGIESIWRPCQGSDCVSALDPDELAVRLVTATPLSARGSLGFAAVDVGRREGTLATVYVDRIEALLARASLPTAAPALGFDSWKTLLARDKKVASGTIRYVLLDAIGKAVISADVGDDTLRELLV